MIGKRMGAQMLLGDVAHTVPFTLTPSYSELHFGGRMVALPKSRTFAMRNSILLRSVVLLLACVSPILLRAQFQQATDEELKMTADPKAPGAAAV